MSWETLLDRSSGGDVVTCTVLVVVVVVMVCYGCVA